MKFLTIILLFVSSLAFGQTTKTQTVVFTSIGVDSAGGGSFYMEYKDSEGKQHYSDMRFEDDIYVDHELMFDYSEHTLVYFNEEYAKECIGKEMVVVYYDQEIKYFGVVPHVTQIYLKD
jgi:hypothetical protein